MSSKRILKVKVVTGSIHYYQAYKNETIRDLQDYLEKVYHYESSKLTFKGKDVHLDQKLSEYLDEADTLVCFVKVTNTKFTRKIKTQPQRHGFNLIPDPRDIDLPPRPELQT